MEVLAYATLLQWKRDLRNKNIFMVYYLIPIFFALLMGAVFTSLMPDIKRELIQVMTVLAVSTSALLGAPVSLVDTYASEIKKAYVVGNIKLWVGVVSNFFSAMIHTSIACVMITIVTSVIFNAKRPDNLLTYVISLFIFMVTSIAIGTVIGLYVKDASKLTIFSQLVYLPSIMLSGIMFNITLLPKIFIMIGRIFPATWGFLAMKESVISLQYILPQIAILCVSIILIVYRLIRIVKE